jgi:hypothetical protein
LAHALQACELGEDQRDRRAHPQVRIFLQTIPGGAHVTDGDAGVELATARFEQQRLVRALA